jgi:predicted O-linked N-acetylglucosamine transferase (SPINDLY family)
VTERFRTLADVWTPIGGLTDAQVADAIRRDGVDILVILGGHTASNRLGVAIRRPAAIQVSYHAPATTGLSEIDYWLSDAVLTPVGWEDRFAERIVRLPTFYAFQEPQGAREPSVFVERAQPVLGSFNNPGKINDRVLDLWSRLLRRMPSARLRLGYHSFFEDPTLQARVKDAMGTSAERVEFLARTPSPTDHFDRLGTVDIVLDTFPFGGATSTFEALWMGTPVVTLAGDRFVGRVGAALCRSLGLDDLVAVNADDYLDKVAALWANVERRRELRLHLRARARSSPMMDYTAQAQALESAYRLMWHEYCGRAKAPTTPGNA